MPHCGKTNTETTLLYPRQPDLDGAAFCSHLNDRLAAAGIPDVLEYAPATSSGFRLHGPYLSLKVTPRQAPLGAECFIGAISSGAAAPARAALTGIVAHHNACIGLAAGVDDAAPDAPGALRERLKLLHIAAATLHALHPPLAVLWGPTNQLLQTDDFATQAGDDLPLPLFLSFRNRVLGPRRMPALLVEGAQTWTGLALRILIRPSAPGDPQAAALAFIRATMNGEAAPREQSFHHNGFGYRIAHSPDGQGIDLIPTGNLPTDLLFDAGIDSAPRATAVRPAHPVATSHEKSVRPQI